jgi:hypothetical protein
LKKSLILVWICLISAGSHAQLIRKYSNEFLTIGAGARGLAMSGAVTASTEGTEAGYWNPAGMLHGDFLYDAALMHASWFASIANFDYLSLAFSPAESPYRFGVSLFRFAIDDIQNTLNLVDQEGQVDYGRITRFSAADYALMAHFAMPVTGVENLQLGFNTKLIYRNIGPFANAFGFGFDVGVAYRPGNWQLSAVVRDATTTFNAWFINEDQLKEAFEQTGNEMPEENIELTPPVLTLGVARRFALSPDFGLLTEVNTSLLGGPQAGVNFGTVLTVNPSIGLEADYREWVYLRFGAGRFQKTTTFNGGEHWLFSPSMGLGLQFGRLKIDYALTNLVSFESALISHVFSLRMQFVRK